MFEQEGRAHPQVDQHGVCGEERSASREKHNVHLPIKEDEGWNIYEGRLRNLL